MKRRFLNVLVLSLLCSILMFFTIVAVNAATPDMSHGLCYFGSTQFGEDASTEATAHFHSENSKVYVMLTTEDDAGYSEAIKVEVEKVKVDFSAPLAGKTEPLKQDVGFPDPSWECNGYFKNLIPGTKYKWYATDGTEKGQEFHFKTAEGDNTQYTFTATTDPQTYTAGARWERYNNWSEAIFKTAENNKMEIAFSINLGDIIENSGRAEHWSYTFGPQFYKKIAAMSTPGNHDFTGLISSGGTDGRFFAAMWANPLNGPEGIHPEICYYFMYNDTLFVTLSCSCADRSKQVAWLDEVLKNNPAQYKVIQMHYPANSDATDNSKEFIPIYDKYNVDLVFYGHTHTYGVQRNYYNRQKSSNPNIGTTYISPSSSEGDYGNPVVNQLFFTVNDSMILYKGFTPDTVQKDSFALLAKRMPTKDTKNYDEASFLASLNGTADTKTFDKFTINYDKQAYNNVYKMSVVKDGTELGSKYITDSVNNYLTISNLTPKTVYDCKLVLEYYDGTTKEVDYQMDTNIQIYGELQNLQEKYVEKLGYRFNYKPSFRPEVKSLAVYVDDAKVLDAAITDKKIVVPEANLPQGTKHKIEIKTVLEDGTEKVLHTSYYGEDATKYTVKFVGLNGEVLSEQQVVEGESAKAPEAPALEGFVFKGWDKEFANVTTDLTITAIYEALVKTYTVTFLGKDGAEIAKVEVEEGQAAKAPEAPALEGFAFKGWDKEFTNVTSDLTVTAVYVETYTVTFLGKDRAEIAKVTVEKGQAAKAPTAPAVDGFVFKSWDKDFTNVTSNLTVTAVYEAAKKTYKVTFVGKDGAEIAKVEVEEGQAAKAPTAPEVEGYEFTGWDKEFTNVTSDLTVTALYKEVKSGCNSGAAVLFTSLMLLGLVFIRRRKH